MRRVGNTLIAAVTVASLCAGTWLLHHGTETHAPPQPTAAQAHSGEDAGTGTGTGRSGGDRNGRSTAIRSTPALPPSPPTRIRIPALHVDAPLTGLSLTPAGRLAAPPADRENLAGWYEAGTTPGERGTAVVAGHVDTADGPAVFYDLGALRKHSTVEVDRRDGTVAVFTVDAVEVYDARRFPDARVYGAAARPELRVITCGGAYAKTTGYQGNVVVFAHLTGSRG